jgi:hypothetical protein
VTAAGQQVNKEESERFVSQLTADLSETEHDGDIRLNGTSAFDDLLGGLDPHTWDSLVGSRQWHTQLDMRGLPAPALPDRHIAPQVRMKSANPDHIRRGDGRPESGGSPPMLGDRGPQRIDPWRVNGACRLVLWGISVRIGTVALTRAVVPDAVSAMRGDPDPRGAA